MGSPRRHRRVVLAASVAALLVMSGIGALGAGAAQAPKSRMAQLKDAIATTEHDVERLKQRLLSTAKELTERQTEYTTVVTQVAAARDRLDQARSQYEQVRSLLDQRARDAYMAGPGAPFAVLFGAGSLGDVALFLEAQDRQAQSDGDLASAATTLQRTATAGEARVTALLAQQSKAVADLDQRRQDLTEAFAQQQVLLDQLVATRKELQQLTAVGPGGAARSAGMTISFGQWALELLRELALPECQNNQISVVTWETAEYTSATWNPLATTYAMPGATKFNSAGVRNYRSLAQGLDATASTLYLGASSHGYGDIIAALAQCAPSEVTAEAIAASDWCHGCAGGNYVTGLLPAVEASFGR